VLAGIGLASQEEQVYLELLRHPEQTRADLEAAFRDWPRARVRRLLSGLVDRGLATTLAGLPMRYSAVAPDVAVEGLARLAIDQARRTQQTIPDLMELYWRAHEESSGVDFLEVVTGDLATLQNRGRQLMTATQHTVRAFERPPLPWEPKTLDADELARRLAADMAVERDALARGVRFQVVYDQEQVDDPARWAADLRSLLSEGEEARVIGSLPVKLILYDDWAATIPVVSPRGEQMGRVIVHKSSLLDGLAALFEAYWARAVPLQPAASSTSEGFDAELLACLAGGQTDDTTARVLGVSRSTVQRRVKELMTAAGVRTRFQLGLALRHHAKPGRPPLAVPEALQKRTTRIQEVK
jgi:sugar-specific transcriptional regulator TrmB